MDKKQELKLAVFDVIRGVVTQKAQGLIEYALIIILVAIIVLVVLAIFGSGVGNMFSNIMSNI